MFSFLANLLRRKGNLLVAIETPELEGYAFEGDYAKVSVTNLGQRSMTVTSLTLEFLGSRKLADCSTAPPDGSQTSLPATLASGEVARVAINLKDVSDRLLDLGSRTRSRLYGRCTDSAGNVYRSEPWSLQPGPLKDELD
jgi:hypothetical protein